jgi:hypothetical protein
MRVMHFSARQLRLAYEVLVFAVPFDIGADKFAYGHNFSSPRPAFLQNEFCQRRPDTSAFKLRLYDGMGESHGIAIEFILAKAGGTPIYRCFVALLFFVMTNFDHMRLRCVRRRPNNLRSQQTQS